MLSLLGVDQDARPSNEGPRRIVEHSRTLLADLLSDLRCGLRRASCRGPGAGLAWRQAGLS